MIKNPEYKLQWIGIKETDIVSIHYESTYQVQRALDWLAPYGCKRFLAINPATPINALEEVLDYIDGINLLMVNPGFAGQKIVPSTMKKAQKVMDFLKQENRQKAEILYWYSEKMVQEMLKNSANPFLDFRDCLKDLKNFGLDQSLKKYFKTSAEELFETI